MSDRANQLVQAVLALTPEERDEVMRQLWDREYADLPEYEHTCTEEEEHAELLRRLESVANGTADPLPLDETMTQLRQELARRRDARIKQQP